MKKVLMLSILLWGFVFFINTDEDFNEGYASEEFAHNYQTNNLSSFGRIRENIVYIISYSNKGQEKFEKLVKGGKYVYWKTVVAKVTGYDPSYVSCGRFADGKTSIGDDAFILDGCAVDPSAIPYRSLIYIPGVGFKEADDTGSAMKKSWKSGIYHIDLRFLTNYEAEKWGVRFYKVDIYLPEKVLSNRK